MAGKGDLGNPPTIDRRDFLKAAAGGVGALTWPRIGLAEPASSCDDVASMNILFIVVEDWSTAGLHCYGNDIVQTPNIDAFAQTGVRFTRAYCQGPCCNPSRSSFLTGLRPDTTGVYSNEHPMSQHLPQDAVSIAELLKRKGAFTARLGKLYHYPHTAEKQLHAFDRLEMRTGPKGYRGITRGYSPPRGTPPEPKYNFTYYPDPATDAQLKKLKAEQKELEKKYPPGTRGRWSKVTKPFYQVWTELLGDCGKPEEHTYDGKIARYSAQIIKEYAAKNRQFFLSVGLHAPHTPLIAPKKYVDMYDPTKMPLPQATPDQDRGVPDVARKFGNNWDLFHTLQQTTQNVRNAIAGYYACSTFTDAQVGIILRALDQAGIAHKTIVFLLSDHGFHLGEHGCWSKYTLFEQSTRVPFIVRLPGAKGNGQACDGIVELVDLLPTMADLWNIDPPKNFEGISFAPLLDTPQRPWKKAAFTVLATRGLGRSVRTKRYKYAEYTKKGAKAPYAVELYDLHVDPWEQNNVVHHPAYAQTVAELAKLLAAGWKAALPPS